MQENFLELSSLALALFVYFPGTYVMYVVEVLSSSYVEVFLTKFRGMTVIIKLKKKTFFDSLFLKTDSSFWCIVGVRA